MPQRFIDKSRVNVSFSTRNAKEEGQVTKIKTQMMIMMMHHGNQIARIMKIAKKTRMMILI